MAKAKATIATKIKKKVWIPIIAPKAFGGKVLGETYVVTPEEAIGKTVHANLKDFTDNVKDQHVYITFKVKSFADGSLTTDVTGYELTSAYIKKLVKRNSDKVSDSQVLDTSENKSVVIKPILLTRSNAAHAIGTELRHAMRIWLQKEVKKLNFGNLIDKLVSHKLQNDLKKELSKIYPLKSLEIYRMQTAEKRD